MCSVFYQARYYHGNDCLLAADAVSEASSFPSSYAFLFPRENSSLILGNFGAFGRDCKLSLQVLEASVADKVLVVWSISSKGGKKDLRVWSMKVHTFYPWHIPRSHKSCLEFYTYSSSGYTRPSVYCIQTAGNRKCLPHYNPRTEVFKSLNKNFYLPCIVCSSSWEQGCIPSRRRSCQPQSELSLCLD